MESCFSTLALSQAGQETPSPQRRTSFSNFAEHWRHSYSYSGIYFAFANVVVLRLIVSLLAASPRANARANG